MVTGPMGRTTATAADMPFQPRSVSPPRATANSAPAFFELWTAALEKEERPGTAPGRLLLGEELVPVLRRRGSPDGARGPRQGQTTPRMVRYVPSTENRRCWAFAASVFHLSNAGG